MFGFKRKEPRPNPMWDRVLGEMRHELHHNDDESSTASLDEKYDDISYYLRTDGKRNASIPRDLLKQLPYQWQKKWNLLDLEKCFPQEEEQDKIDKISKTPVNLKLLSRDLDLTKQAKDLDIDRDDKYSDEVGL